MAKEINELRQDRKAASMTVNANQVNLDKTSIIKGFFEKEYFTINNKLK